MLARRRLEAATIPADPIGEQHYVATRGQRIRVNIRHGSGVPLVLCNSIGASLEVLDPLVERLDPDSTVIRFDVPGTGAPPISVVPYGFPYLARVLGRVLSKLGFNVVDVLGISWGGVLAQQFALQNPRRCRRLVLVATGTGALMVPTHRRILARMRTARRFSDAGYAASTAAQQLHAGSKIGYFHQLLAGSVWTRVFGLPAVRQNTLIVADPDDPLVPVIINARIMDVLLPHSRLHLHSGGHIDLVNDAAELAPVVGAFLREPEERP